MSLQYCLPLGLWIIRLWVMQEACRPPKCAPRGSRSDRISAELSINCFWRNESDYPNVFQPDRAVIFVARKKSTDTFAAITFPARRVCLLVQTHMLLVLALPLG